MLKVLFVGWTLLLLLACLAVSGVLVYAAMRRRRAAREELLLRRSVGEVVRFVEQRQTNYKNLYELTRGVSCFPHLVERLDRVVDSDGTIRDTASEELYAIRRSIREREGQAAKRLQQVLQASLF